LRTVSYIIPNDSIFGVGISANSKHVFM